MAFLQRSLQLVQKNYYPSLIHVGTQIFLYELISLNESLCAGIYRYLHAHI